jgi:hypothetical protein
MAYVGSFRLLEGPPTKPRPKPVLSLASRSEYDAHCSSPSRAEEAASMAIVADRPGSPSVRAAEALQLR